MTSFFTDGIAVANHDTSWEHEKRSSFTKETKLMSTHNTNKLANKVVEASTKAPNHSAKKSSGG